MKRECLQVEDQIWEHVHHGCMLSEEAQRHMEECAECARALREASLIQPVMTAAKQAPDMPDCRSAVLTRISVKRMVPVWGWAGACAAVVTAVVVAWTMLAVPRPVQRSAPEVRVVKRLPVTKQTPALPLKQDKPLVEHQTVMANSDTPDKPRVSTPIERPQERHAKQHYRPHIEKQAPRQQPVENKSIAQKPDDKLPVISVTQEKHVDDAPRPVAIAIVKWPSQPESDEQLDYSYTQHDAQTGETTTCTARRSGNSVEIFMETKKEDKDQKTIEGSVDDEANRNA